MEVNKDEAERCIDIAIEAMKSGNLDRSEKFLRKAENLYPSKRSKILLDELTQAKARSNHFNNGGASRNRKPATTANSQKQDEEPTASSDYTKDQLEMVRRIKRCKDYYEVLNVTKESTDSDIKKAYKKLALQLHPDKNRAPGAVEAFKAVGNAVAVLTDPNKRKEYDLYGADGQNSFARRNHGGAHHHHGHHEYEFTRGGFESDFSAEDLFNMFFGGEGSRQMFTNPRRAQQQRAAESTQPSVAYILILLLIIISTFSSFFTSDPVYSLSSTSRYTVRRQTMHLNIPYYVKDKFASDYSGSLARLENSVEEEYITIMKQSCYRERSYREIMIARARNFGNNVHLSQAESLQMPSCDNLVKIGLNQFKYH